MKPRNGEEVTAHNVDGGAKLFFDAPPSR